MVLNKYISQIEESNYAKQINCCTEKSIRKMLHFSATAASCNSVGPLVVTSPHLSCKHHFTVSPSLYKNQWHYRQMVWCRVVNLWDWSKEIWFMIYWFSQKGKKRNICKFSFSQDTGFIGLSFLDKRLGINSHGKCTFSMRSILYCILIVFRGQQYYLYWVFCLFRFFQNLVNCLTGYYLQYLGSCLLTEYIYIFLLH